MKKMKKEKVLIIKSKLKYNSFYDYKTEILENY